MKLLFLIVILSPLIAAGAYHAALNMSGEVVLLYYYDADGREYMTPLWLVRERGDLFLRATDPQRGWLERIRENPEISIRRGDARERYRAIPDPHRRDLVNQLTAETYGWGEWLLSRLNPRPLAVPVRLAPR